MELLIILGLIWLVTFGMIHQLESGVYPQNLK